MKKLFSSLIILVFCQSIWGQNLVSIPDSSFRRQLKAQFPNTFVGEMLDTTAAGNIYYNNIQIYGNNVYSIEGIQHFKNIFGLYVSSTNISVLPEIPLGVGLLFCNNNKLTTLPTLPPNLTTLDCSNNLITALPSLALKTLTSVNISNNRITICPPLGRKLNDFNCKGNLISCLPKLPGGLQTLQTDVDCIPNVPINLTTHPPLCNATNNPNACPIYPFSEPIISGKVYADLNKNGLKDSLENGIAYALIRINPGNYTIFADANGDYSFEVDTIENYTVSLNKVYQYGDKSPVLLSKLNYNTNTKVNFGLQQELNPVVYGVVFNDENNNNVKDSTETVLPNRSLIIQPGNIQLYTNNNGEYTHLFDSIGSYTISLTNDTLSTTVLSDLKINSRTEVNFGIRFSNGYLIPDTSFRIQLIAQFPNCFVGQMLDTIAASNISLQSRQIFIYGNNVQSIEGIQFFKEPKYLTIESTQITFVPRLGMNITNLYINNNNKLENIEAFPNSLTSLYVRNNSKLDTIPTLPNNIKYLDLSSNNLKGIGSLPDSLTFLSCQNNKIAYLPNLTQKKLEFVAFNDNQVLDCPVFGKSIERIISQNNVFRCLKPLPSRLWRLGTDVICLPNAPLVYGTSSFLLTSTGIDLSTVASGFLPICTANNPNACPINQFSQPIISGKVYADLNKNGQKDSTENGIPNAAIRINPGNQTIYTDVNGNYSFEADTIENYAISVDPVLNYATSNAIFLSKLHFNSITNVDFGLQRKFMPIIYGSVFNDLNNNSINDSTDIPVRYRTILINPGNKTVTSDNFGNYEFEADTLTSYTLELESDSNTRQYISNLQINSRSKIDFPIHFNTGYLIPDTSFRRQLKDQLPNFFVGDLIDTSASFRNLGIGASGANVKSIEGIQYLKFASIISIYGTDIQYVPRLYENSTYLSIVDNPNLIKIENLPTKLDFLLIGNNSMLDTIPELPNHINTIYLYGNNLKKLPLLPINLKSLYCYDNKLTELPILPNGLKFLDCHNNKINILPNIPDSLEVLYCSSNKLIFIQDLTSERLNVVSFDWNNISICPAFGENIKRISCKMNSFKCLKTLPFRLEYLDTDVHCLPNAPLNYGTSMFDLSSLTGIVPPICNPTNNPNNCNANPIISGTVYYDLNNNQIYDLGDTPAENGKITISPFGGTTFTNALGQYVYSMDTVGTYVLNLATVPYFAVSPSVTVNGAAMNSTATANFYLSKIADVKDMAISITPYQAAARPGFYFSLNVEVKNNGSLPTPSTLTFNLPSQYSVTGILFPNCTSTSAINSCSIGTLRPGQMVSGKIEGRLFTTATLGDSLVFETTVNNSDASDANLADNLSSTKMIIRGSYDPNDKAATNLNPSKVGQSQWIDYTIRFQNTGTDTAFTVVVSDSLPSQLLASSVELLSASHTCKFSQSGTILYFQFDNILLPDSNTNEKLSNGYIKFRAKTKPNLSLQSTVNNRAAIYFDYNSPIITNYATSTFVQPGRVTAVYTNAYQSNETWVYPNPIQNGRLFVRKFNNESVRLFNSSGHLMFQGVINEDGLNVTDYPSGIYLIQSDKLREKIVIE